MVTGRVLLCDDDQSCGGFAEFVIEPEIVLEPAWEIFQFPDSGIQGGRFENCVALFRGRPVVARIRDVRSQDLEIQMASVATPSRPEDWTTQVIATPHKRSISQLKLVANTERLAIHTGHQEQFTGVSSPLGLESANWTWVKHPFLHSGDEHWDITLPPVGLPLMVYRQGGQSGNELGVNYMAPKPSGQSLAWAGTRVFASDAAYPAPVIVVHQENLVLLQWTSSEDLRILAYPGLTPDAPTGFVSHTLHADPRQLLKRVAHSDGNTLFAVWSDEDAHILSVARTLVALPQSSRDWEIVRFLANTETFGIATGGLHRGAPVLFPTLRWQGIEPVFATGHDWARSDSWVAPIMPLPAAALRPASVVSDDTALVIGIFVRESFAEPVGNYRLFTTQDVW